MNKNKLVYGSLGLLSLLGILGIVTEHKIYLSFFAFAIHFQYLFLDTDEMMESYMNKSSSIAFYVNHLCFVLVSLFRILILREDLYETIIFSLTLSWIASILVYTALIVTYDIKERMGMKND